MVTKFGNWQNFLDKTLLKLPDRVSVKFKQINSLTDIIEFVWKQNYLNVPWINAYFTRCAEAVSTKSSTEANKWRTEGNKLFQRKCYKQAVDAYSKCIQYAEPCQEDKLACSEPQPASDPELSMGLANRSAALLRMGHTQACLDDLDLALCAGYPAHLQYKLYQRRAVCLTRLGNTEGADTAAKNAEEAIQSLQVESSKKDKLLEDLRKALREDAQMTCKVVDQKVSLPSPHHGNSAVITQASRDVLLKYSPEKGRHLVAAGPLPAGSVIIVERPFAAVLLPSHYNSHCHHCFRTLLSPIPCQQCITVSYCSELCRAESWGVYHSVECRFMELFHSIGIAHLSLRIVLTAGRKFLINFRDLTRDPSLTPGLTSAGVYDRSYRSVYDLMPHDEDMETDDLIQYALTAALLLRVLQQAGFFGDKKPSDKSTHGALSPEESYVGSLLLRHICQLVCNAHAITELQLSAAPHSPHLDLSQQVRVATAIYPTASLMNHACDPTIIASFSGDTLVVRTIKDVAAGDEVYNCYGPHCARMPRADRQRHLAEQYFFTCRCEPCTLEGSTEQRREALRCPSCSGAMTPDPVTPVTPLYTCASCGSSIDMAAALRLEEEATGEFVSGLQQLQANNLIGAVSVLSRCLATRRRVLYQSHHALGEVYDVLARIYAIQGDYKRASEYLAPSVTITETNYGPRSIELANELHKHAEILAQAGSLAECLSTAERARDIFLLSYGEDNQCTREIIELISGVRSMSSP